MIRRRESACPGWRERGGKVGKSILILLGIGMLYAFFCTVTGLRLPCAIYAVTGLCCPGCGVTRMCLALLRLDFAAAFRSNQLLFLSLPVLAAVIGGQVYSYIRYGRARLGKAANGVLILLIVAFLVFGVVRNLPGMEELRPPVA